MELGSLEKVFDKIKTRVPALALVGYLAFLFLLLAGVAYHTYFSQRAPDQPIEFNHSVHVTGLGLACDYCHMYADESVAAGIPPMSLCMECHENAARDNEEVQKLVGYWEREEPVPWVRVHSLPDHAYFTHKRHIKAGVDCTECHGQVSAMTVARQVKSLKMGWCVSCHRSRGAPTDCLICHK
jgi:hypothetical protein